MDNEELQPPAAVARNQHDPSSAYGVAYDLLSRREPAAALEVIDPALELEPTNRGLRSLRAWAYLIRAQLQKAEAELVTLVEERPDDDWARHALGRALERQSRLSEALPHLRLAAAMTGDPEHEAAVLRVERRLAETGVTSYDDLS